MLRRWPTLLPIYYHLAASIRAYPSSISPLGGPPDQNHALQYITVGGNMLPPRHLHLIRSHVPPTSTDTLE